MKKSGSFYFIVIDKLVLSVWYKKILMGKNIINIIMKNMKENLSLKDLCFEKNLINYSVRKIVVKKLKSFGISKCEIKNIIGYIFVNGFDDYDSGDERE